METWDYKQMGDLDDSLQESWNQTLITKLNKMSIHSGEPIDVEVSLNLKPIIDSLIVKDDYVFNFTDNHENTIKIYDSKLKILNYVKSR